MKQLIDYIGIPYKYKGRAFDGCDCYGIPYLYHKHILGNTIPSFFGYLSAEDRDGIEQGFLTGIPMFDRIEKPDLKEGDFVVFNLGGRPIHVGLLIDKFRFLHCLSGHDSAMERIDSPKWNRRVEGFYRWAS